MHLTHEQISFFKTNGYLLVPGAMDVQRCAEVRDLMWAALPPESKLQRDDPESHAGPFPEHEDQEDSLQYRHEYRWLNRSLGVNHAVIQLIYSEAICAMAEQLLGGTLRQVQVDGTPMGSRGPVWPAH